MRIVKIEEIKSLDHKEVIPSIHATLTKIYDYKTGEGQHGAYSFQNGMLRDSTGEMKVVFSNKDDMKGMLNRNLSITSYSGDKGLSGVYADDNEYKGATTRQIKITSTADISIVDSEASPVKSEKKTSSPFNPDANTVVAKWAKAAELALDTMLGVKDRYERNNNEMPPAQFQALTSGLLIYLDRKGVIEAMEIEKPDEVPF